MEIGQHLTEECGGFTGFELVGDLVFLLTEAKGVIAIKLYLTDSATGGNNASVVNCREKDRGSEQDRTDWFLQDRERGKCWRLTTMISICASGRGIAGRWITDPFSLPDGTPVTKVGLDCGV